MHLLNIVSVINDWVTNIIGIFVILSVVGQLVQDSKLNRTHRFLFFESTFTASLFQPSADRTPFYLMKYNILHAYVCALEGAFVSHQSVGGTDPILHTREQKRPRSMSLLFYLGFVYFSLYSIYVISLQKCDLNKQARLFTRVHWDMTGFW